MMRTSELQRVNAARRSAEAAEKKAKRPPTIVDWGVVYPRWRSWMDDMYRKPPKQRP